MLGLSVYLSIYLSVILSVYLSVCLSVCELLYSSSCTIIAKQQCIKTLRTQQI